MPVASAPAAAATAAAKGGALGVSTLEQLASDKALHDAWALQQGLSQLLACAFDDRADVEAEPATFHARLATAVGEKDFKALVRRLERTRKAARKAFDKALPPPGGLAT